MNATPAHIAPSYHRLLHCISQGLVTRRSLEIYTQLSPRRVTAVLFSLYHRGWVSTLHHAVYGERWQLTDAGRDAMRLDVLRQPRRAMVSDGDLLKALASGEGIRKVSQRLGYLDDSWMRRRLRRMGLPPGAGGRPYLLTEVNETQNAPPR